MSIIPRRCLLLTMALLGFTWGCVTMEPATPSRSISRPFLGLGMQELTPELRTKLGVERGVVISDLIPGDPAATAGVQSGDILLEVDGTSVNHPLQALATVWRRKAGEAVRLTVSRDGLSQSITVVSRRRVFASADDAEATEACPMKEHAARIGIEVEPGREAPIITSVTPASPAARAKLRAGDVLLEANGVPLGTVEDLCFVLSAWEDTEPFFRVGRGGDQRQLLFTINDN